MRHPERNIVGRIVGPVLVAALTLFIGLAPAARADADLWLHVRVDGRQGETVSVNLPLSLVEAALPLIPEEHLHDGQIVLDHHHWGAGGHRLSVADLRDIWRELKASPDMTFVTVEDHEETVRVAKSGAYLVVDIDDRGREASQIRMPVAVVDALLSGDGESLDVRAAIAALAEHGEGELVTVSEDDETVRVWVDRIPEAR